MIRFDGLRAAKAMNKDISGFNDDMFYLPIHFCITVHVTRTQLTDTPPSNSSDVSSRGDICKRY